MILDSHTHFPPRALPGSGHNLLKNAAPYGIGGALVSHVLEFPEEPSSAEIRTANQFTAAECAANPGRLFFLAYLNPQQADWDLELDRCIQSGAIGIKLWVAMRDRSGSLTKTIAVLKRAAILGLPVLLHTFDRTDGNLRGEIGIAEFCQISQQVPECRMIAAHLGCNWRQALAWIPKASKNTYFDCCGTFPERGMVHEIIQVIPAERLLYGSDWPCRSFASQLFKIREAGLSEETAELILWRNTAGLYRLPAPPNLSEIPLEPLSMEFKTDHFCFCGNFPSGSKSGSTPEELETLLNQNGIDTAMTVDASSIFRADISEANRNFSAATRNLQRVRPLAIVNPRAADALQTIAAAENNSSGLWFSPYWHVWKLNDPAYAQIWKAAAASGLPIYINCGTGEYRVRPVPPEIRPIATEELCAFPDLLPAGVRCCIQGFPGRIPADWPESGAEFLWTATHLSDYGSAHSGSALADQLSMGNTPRLVSGSEYPFRALDEVNTVWRKIQTVMRNSAGREYPFSIGRLDDFNVFLPSDNENDLIELTERYRQAASVDRNTAQQPLIGTPLPITGSFIYAHPPDYRGRPMLHAGTDEWRETFNELRELGMDSVIFQAALWQELEECYYSSRRFSQFRCFRVVEPMLEAAEKEKFTVYLGGFGSCIGWTEAEDRRTLERELENHRECFKELVTLGNFAGMYFPCETAYRGYRDDLHARRMNRLYREFSSMVKSYNPNLKIISSPATKYYPGREEEFMEFWDMVLTDANLDVFMPQDSIGTLCCPLVRQREMWKLWRQLADRHRMALWSNTELFERLSFEPGSSFGTADSQRVMHQLANVSGFSEKYYCWEALYFPSPAAGQRGIQLRQVLRRLAEKAESQERRLDL